MILNIVKTLHVYGLKSQRNIITTLCYKLTVSNNQWSHPAKTELLFVFRISWSDHIEKNFTCDMDTDHQKLCCKSYWVCFHITDHSQVSPEKQVDVYLKMYWKKARKERVASVCRLMGLWRLTRLPGLCSCYPDPPQNWQWTTILSRHLTFRRTEM